MAATLVAQQRSSDELDAAAVILNEGRLADEIRASGAQTFVVNEANNGFLAIFFRLLQIVQDLRPSIVHTHRQKENVLGSLAATWRRVPSIRTVHGGSEHSPPPWQVHKHAFAIADRLAGRFLQRGVVAVSERQVSELERLYGSGKVSFVPNGVELDRIRQQASLAEDGPERTNEWHVGIVARLVPVKRHDLFIEAAATLHREKPGGYRFHIFGDGPESDRIRQRVDSLGLTNVVDLHGHVDNAAAAIAGLDSLVFCSDHEGTPMAALEAAALGTPIVSTPLESIREIIDSGAPGRICTEQSAQGLAAELALASGSTDSAPLAADWPYSAQSMARGYAALYDRCIGTNDRPKEAAT